MSSGYINLPVEGGAVVGPLDITNAATDGIPGTASQITTGDPNTVGLIIQGTMQTSIPSDVTFYNNFATLNATYAKGSITGTATGGATVVANRLDLSGDANKYVSYSATLNANMAQILTIQFKYTPNYTGVPDGITTLFSIFQTVSSDNNLIYAYISGAGFLNFVVNDPAGAPIISAVVGDISSQLITGVPLELEFDIDITNGVTSVYVAGVQTATSALTGVRSTASTLIRIGASPYGDTNSDAFFEDFSIFNDIQHASPTYSVPTPPIGAVPQMADLLQFKDSTGTVLSNVNAAGEFSYVPSDGTKWADPDPTTVNEALDRMAALLYTLNSNTPIP